LKEEDYYIKYKELVGEDIHINSLDSKSALDGGGNKDFLQQQDRHDEVLQQREVEINNLVKTINELSSMFKDLQMLVVEQGTILDRIDYNIESTEKIIIDANDHLTQADKNLASNCARNANLTLIAVIFVLSLLILMKLTR
jgi:syntaxin 16